MRLRTIVFAAVLILSSTAMAVDIGPFPGIGTAIRKADAVVILSVHDHIDTRPNPSLYTTHECYIYQTLKGDIPAGKRIRLRLMDTRTSFVTPYARSSTHLMFLTKKRTPNEPTEYRTIEFQGANIRLSPFGHEKMPKGKTIEDKVKALIKDSLEYRQKQYEKERGFLIASLEGAKPAANDSVIPVTVTGKIESAVVKQGEPIPLSVTISNGLKGPIRYSTYSLKPNDWNGETVSLTLVDIYRDGKPPKLFLERPKVKPPLVISGMSSKRIKSGRSLTASTDARKWKITGGWVPGKYKINVRVQVTGTTVDGNRCILSVHSDPFEFEIR